MKKGLRSRLAQYGDEEFALFLRRGFLKGAGFTDEALDRPIVGILSTASDFNPCHKTAPQVAEAVARGVRMAGALPFTFPTISLHEAFSFPTSMLLRNLMAMDVEEMIAALPLDAVVLIGGCDKTIPAELMGAISADMPAIIVNVQRQPGANVIEVVDRIKKLLPQLQSTLPGGVRVMIRWS